MTTPTITLDLLESRASAIGQSSPEYYTSWPRTWDLTRLINRAWQPGDMDTLLDGVDADHRDMVLSDYSGQLFAIAVVAAHETIAR
jgi:hypothetical protein